MPTPPVMSIDNKPLTIGTVCHRLTRSPYYAAHRSRVVPPSVTKLTVITAPSGAKRMIRLRDEKGHEIRFSPEAGGPNLYVDRRKLNAVIARHLRAARTTARKAESKAAAETCRHREAVKKINNLLAAL